MQRCDILVPAALERVITADNVEKIDCRILAEAANGPTTPEADVILDQRRDEIFVLLDILCNAGGVIVSYFEWVQGLQQYFWDEVEVVERLNRALERSLQHVLSRATRGGISYRNAALAIGVEVVQQAKQVRGLFP
jgi:glutamate dehydrogenase (NAD(P)+)